LEKSRKDQLFLRNFKTHSLNSEQRFYFAIVFYFKSSTYISQYILLHQIISLCLTSMFVWFETVGSRVSMKMSEVGAIAASNENVVSDEPVVWC
jgi:hypothetical protein